MRRAGFTLVEILVALLLTGVLMLAGGRAFAASLDHIGAIERAEEALAWRGNRRAWLERAFLAVEVGTAPGTAFEGDSNRVRFMARMLTAGGWCEREIVELSAAGGVLVLRSPSHGTVVLAPHAGVIAFDYLTVPGLASRWAPSWHSPVSAPVAVRLRLGRTGAEGAVDTLILFIGERG